MLRINLFSLHPKLSQHCVIPQYKIKSLRNKRKIIYVNCSMLAAFLFWMTWINILASIKYFKRFCFSRRIAILYLIKTLNYLFLENIHSVLITKDIQDAWIILSVVYPINQYINNIINYILLHWTEKLYKLSISEVKVCG